MKKDKILDVQLIEPSKNETKLSNPLCFQWNSKLTLAWHENGNKGLSLIQIQKYERRPRTNAARAGQ
jgi:hypothetical protein